MLFKRTKRAKKTKRKIPKTVQQSIPVDVIYKASSEKKLYQWNIELQKYEVLTTAQMEEDEDKVIILYGGSATDNLEAT